MAMVKQRQIVVGTGPEEFVAEFVQRFTVPKGTALERPDTRTVVLRRRRLGPFFVGLFFSVVAPVVGWLVGWAIVSQNARWRFVLRCHEHPEGCILDFEVYLPDDQTVLDRLAACQSETEQMWLGIELVTRQTPVIRPEAEA